MTKMKGWLSAFKSKDSDDSRILFVVFEDEAQKKNLLSRETFRHRLAYAQAKNPKANIVSAEIMSRVQVGHNLSVTSDKPTFMAINLQKGTFREHKGKLTNVELDKFVRQVESGHLNIVRKLQSHFQSWNGYTDKIVRNPEVSAAAIIGNDGSIWGVSGGEFSRADTHSVADLIFSRVEPSSVTFRGMIYNVKTHQSKVKAILTKFGTEVVIYKTEKAIVVGCCAESQDQAKCDLVTGKVADFMIEIGF